MKGNEILKIITNNSEVFYVEIPTAIQKTRNMPANAVAWAKEVLNDVKTVQFERVIPNQLVCEIDIEGFAIPVWEFNVFIPFMKPEEFANTDENIEKVENWLDSHIYNMSSWAERN
jgi:hypothetical protein